MGSSKIMFVEQNIDGTIGGSHYCLLYLIQKLDRTKFEPLTIFYESNPLISQFQKEGETIVVNLRSYSKIRSMLFRKIVNLFMHISHFTSACLLVLKHKIKIIHLNDTVAGGFDIWIPVSMLFRIPCITHERSFPSLKNIKGVDWYLMSKYSKVLAVSNVVKDNLTSQGFTEECVVTVYDGIDPEKYKLKVNRTTDAIRSEFNIPENIMIIGLIGNIRFWKGQELLLDSLNILNKKFPNFKCLFVGDIAKDTLNDVQYKEKLIQKSIDYGVKDKIIFTGYRSDVPDIINALDIQINASVLPDPFPHVILEAMALGKVVVATNLGGAIESIEDCVTGFVVPSDDPTNLADKIQLILSDNILREKMQKAARSRIQKFHIDKNVLETQDIYTDLLNKHTSKRNIPVAS
jgi:glycosyltransferase involved in cell wall biosynthesis